MTSAAPLTDSAQPKLSPVAFDPFAPTWEVVARTAPTTEPQRELWTAARFGEDANLSYNESVTLRVRGPLDVEALRDAIADVIVRHDALRASVSGDGFTLCIAEPDRAKHRASVAFVDLAELPQTAARVDALAAHAARIVREPFDLTRGPLFRSAIVRLAAEDHALTLTAHHIVCDGWSTALILKDLLAAYDARRRGRAPELEPAPSFVEYARAEALALGTSPEHRAAEAHWTKALAGDIPPLELPLDRPRPVVKTYASRRHDHVLDATLVKAVRQAGAKAGASLFQTLLSGFFAFLHRVTGQEDLVVGIPAAGQAIEGREGIVGHCVNTLPIRARLHRDLAPRELLGAVKATMLDAFEHQRCTFGSILRLIKVRRDPSRLPLVSVVFNLDRGLGPNDLPIAGATTELSTNPRAYENFDLFVNAVELDGKVVLECQYNVDLFGEDTIARWLATYEELLRSLAATASDPGAKVGALAMLTARDRDAIASWNARSATAVERAELVLAHERLRAVALRSPEKTAVAFEGRAVRYDELERRSNQLARRLRELGVRRGSMVGLSLERSPELVIGLFAILKAGAAYVPLDPAYPADRLAFMASDAKMPVVVTERRVTEDVRFGEAQCVLVDEHAPAIAACSADPIAPSAADAELESPAYVIYTSGSTGKPKGVVVPHRALANLLSSVEREPGMSERDVVLAVTTLSFDIAVSELVLPLTVGATVALATREVAADGGRLLRLLEDSRATFLDATPATYRLLLGAGWTGSPGLRAICTGEALPRELAQKLVPLTAELWNGYGPTETTVWSTFERISAPVERVLIGHPIANTQIHVLDPDMRPVPVGVPGELWIGGRGVTLGYLGRPDLTKERFVPDPFRGEGLLYRTGDLGRWLDGGRLECLGRNDGQVKLRGYRIELGEIEAQLERHADVRQAAVMVREDRAGDPRLVGYVVPRTDMPNDKVLKEHLKRALPEYMVPSQFVAMPAEPGMPLTPSGKVDKRALPPPTAPESRSDDHVAPRNATEAMLAELWQEALGLPRVSVLDDFFDLGGHSLLASQILARLRQQHGIELSFRKIFEAPTIAQLAALLDAKGGAPAAPPSARAHVERRADPGAAAPLSLMQERIWLFDEMDPEQRVVHNLPAAWQLTGRLDVAALERALRLVVARHESLRTVFRSEGGRVGQVVLPEMDVPLERVDLRAIPEVERTARMDALFADASRVEFDLARGPLLRTILVQTKDDEHVFFSTRHNIVWDGWSFDVFLKEMREAYGAFVRGAEPRLPALQIGYADFALWQRKELQTPAMQAHVAYWREKLGGDVPVLELPTDRPRAGAGLAGANETKVVSRERADVLAALAKEHGATLYMVLLAAFKTVLHRWTGQTDVVVGTPVRARTLPETEDLIGPFVNALALRTQLDARDTFVDLLARVRDVTLDAFGHQEVPLEAIGGRPPVLRAFFSLQDARHRPTEFGDVSVRQVHVLPAAAGVDITFWMMESKDKLLLVVNYRSDLFDAATIRGFLDQYVTVLDAIQRRPATTLAELEMLSPTAAAEVASFGEGPELATVEGPIDALVLREAGERGSALAASTVGSASPAWRYADLGDAILALAEELARAGVRAGDAVLLAARPGPARAAAFHAALHAGARLVLVDGAWPEPRLRQAAELVAGGAAPIVLADAADRERLRFATVIDAAAQRAPQSRAPRAGSSATAVAVVTLAPTATGALRPRAFTHRDLAHLLASLRAETALSASDVLLALAPPASDLELAELAAFAVGARVVFPHPDDRDDAEAIAEAIAASSASVAFVTSAVARRLGKGPVHGARLVLAGGGRGGASATSIAIRGDVGVGPIALVARGDVLRPAAGARVRILDGAGKPVPGPARGELWVATFGAELDAPRVPDPFDPGRALRSTGLVARWLSGGGLRILAEGQTVLRVGAVEVSTLEIEAELATHAGIAEVAVRAVPRQRGDDGERVLAAYYVRRPDTPAVESEFRRHVRQRLPEACVPRAFVELPALPRDALGRIDEGRLPPPFGEDAVRHVAPRTPIERMLAEIWARELGVATVSVHDNFFDLGGHSLLCFKMLGEVESRTGTRVNPRVVLLSTLEQVALQIAPIARPVEVVPPKEAPPPMTRRLLEKLRLVRR
jgi:amino acid adenylation domain-containing protein